MHITLLGGSGFIGQYLAAELARRGHTLSIPVRNRERVKGNLILLPGADVYGYDPNAMGGLKKGLGGADLVINLVGILNEDSRNLYEQVHGEYVRKLVDSCVNNKVPRFIQISAIGASPSAPSAYLRSKAKGEQTVRNCAAMSHVIIRPSVVYGNGDSFVNRFAGLMKFFPLMPLPMAQAQFQPIYVADLVAMIARVAEDDSYRDQVLCAGGPEVMTLEMIIYKIAEAVGRSPRLFPLGDGLSFLFAAIAEKLPFVDLITRDNCLSMRQPSVCPKDGNQAAAVVGALTTFNSGLAAMYSVGTGYQTSRHFAGRD